MKNHFEDKTLEQMKIERNKNKKLFSFFIGIMAVACIAIVFNAYKDKNWAKLGTCAVSLTLLPMYSGLKSLEDEIKRREELKD